MTNDTIAAVATANGLGGIAVIRVSGPDAHAIVGACFRRKNGAALPVGRLCYGHVTDASGVVDEAMAVRMCGPNTYTCEDVAEIQCHGGPTQARRVLDCVLGLGARAAGPGEFTQRAFVNGRLDLSEAEAVMALVGSGNDAAARAALRQLDGGVSRTMHALAGELTELLALIEAGTDFPDEVEEQATCAQVLDGVRKVRGTLETASDHRSARIVREGLQVVLSGRPNTGKSSLLNALLGSDRAIVTEHAGTTRDLLSEGAVIEGYPVTLMDSAGQRAAQDPIEQMGVARAMKAEGLADLVLLVLDGALPLTGEDEALIARADDRYVAVVNKSDLALRLDVERLSGMKTMYISALTGAGVDAIKSEIAARASRPSAMENQLTIERHLDLAHAAIASLKGAEWSLTGGAPLDLCAIDLMDALRALTEITGASASEAVIERIFASFCVGK